MNVVVIFHLFFLGNWFSVYPQNGSIFSTQILDREIQEDIKLIVKVQYIFYSCNPCFMQMFQGPFYLYLSLTRHISWQQTISFMFTMKQSIRIRQCSASTFLILVTSYELFIHSFDSQNALRNVFTVFDS